MLRITSLNLNGIRSAFKKGLVDWLPRNGADILCLQELKAHLADIDEPLQHPLDYTGHFCAAEKKGYSGVGIYLRAAAEKVTTGIDCEEFDAEGRIIRADWGNLSVVSAYLPSGSSGPDRQEAKFRFLAKFGPWLKGLMTEHQKTGREFVVCGDWNIAHNPAAWELMFNEIQDETIGLEWEPCHQLYYLIDPMPQLRKWIPRIYHVHGKDASVRWDLVRAQGIHGPEPFAYHRHPGFGDTNWTDVISDLRQGGYRSSIDIEGWHDPVYRDELEMTGQVHALNYLKRCRGGDYVQNPA